MNGSNDPIKEFLDNHVRPQTAWYWDESAKFERRLAIWTWIGILLGFLATILAAFPKSLANAIGQHGDEFAKWLVVIASAAATLATGTLVPRYRILARTREMGRVKTTLLEKLAEIELPGLPADKLSLRKVEIVKELMAIEQEYGSDRPGDDRVGSDRAENDRANDQKDATKPKAP